MKIKVKKLHKDAITPRFAHTTDTGFDLFSVEKTIIKPKEKTIVKTGLAFELPKGWGIAVRNKSGITIDGAPICASLYTDRLVSELVPSEERADVTIYLGTIDNGYRGEIGIMIKNETDHIIAIPKHTKLAQGVLERVYHCEFEEVEELSDTERGTGGYGSTGVGVA